MPEGFTHRIHEVFTFVTISIRVIDGVIYSSFINVDKFFWGLTLALSYVEGSDFFEKLFSGFLISFSIAISFFSSKSNSFESLTNSHPTDWVSPFLRHFFLGQMPILSMHTFERLLNRQFWASVFDASYF